MNLQLVIIVVGLLTIISINLWGVYRTSKCCKRLEMVFEKRPS